MLKFHKKLGVYKNSTGSFEYNPSTQEAFSYEWWQLLRNMDGVLVLNTFRYSNSTAKHISNLEDLLGYEGYISVPFAYNLQYASKEELLKTYESRIVELQYQINKPRTRKKKILEIAIQRDNLAAKWNIEPKYEELTKLYRVLY